MESDSNDSTTAYVCTGASEEEMQLYSQLAWWMDGVIQIVVGLIGLAGNTVAIPILLSKKLSRYVLYVNL